MRPVADLEPTSTLGRQHLIDRIIALNPTAPLSFLDRFADSGLRDYLDHLTAAQQPRGREAAWVRRNDTPAIVWREPPE